MSKLIATAVIRGANTLVKRAEEMLQKAIAAHGENYKFEFPDTAFHLPMIYAMTGFAVKTLGDMKKALEETTSGPRIGPKPASSIPTKTAIPATPAIHNRNLHTNNLGPETDYSHRRREINTVIDETESRPVLRSARGW